MLMRKLGIDEEVRRAMCFHPIRRFYFSYPLNGQRKSKVGQPPEDASKETDLDNKKKKTPSFHYRNLKIREGVCLETKNSGEKRKMNDYSRELAEFIDLKEQYKRHRGQPDCSQFKRGYQEIENELWDKVPDLLHFDGRIIVKGIISGKYKVLMVYTPESYKRHLEWRADHPEGRPTTSSSRPHQEQSDATESTASNVSRQP